MSVNDISERKERPPYVMFERRSVEDKPAGLKAGRFVAKDVDYALVTPAYSKDCVENTVERFFLNAETNVKNDRIPREWLDAWRKMYEAWKQGQELPLDGTPIKGWGLISPAQQETLIRMNCRTVEDLAETNDEGLRRIGMGGIELRNKAKNWLNAMKDHGPLATQVTALEKENLNLKTELDSLKDKMNELLKSLPSPSRVIVEREPSNEITAADVIEDERPRRGRPRSVKTSAVN